MEKHLHKCGNCSDEFEHSEEDQQTCAEFIEHITSACKEMDKWT